MRGREREGEGGEGGREEGRKKKRVIYAWERREWRREERMDKRKGRKGIRKGGIVEEERWRVERRERHDEIKEGRGNQER